jgi:hypothetical protein
VEVSGGALHTCARRLDGTAVCWGWVGYGALGDGLPIATSAFAPVVWP